MARTRAMAGGARCGQTLGALDDDPERALKALASACTTPRECVTVSLGGHDRAVSASQADSEPPQRYPLPARGGHCYRAIAAAGRTIDHLAVAVEDSAGVVADEDFFGGRAAVVSPGRAVCFVRDDAATVVVSVGGGAGTYALQVCEMIDPTAGPDETRAADAAAP